ncbi:uncharacterized protein LOC144660575 isoform X1 [Oculina patagonica]
MAVWIQAVVCLLWCITGCHPTSNENVFSTLWDVKEALRKASIELVNIRNDTSGVQHAEAIIGSLNISVQFPWPMNTSGTIQLPSNHSLPVPDIHDFAGKLAHQVGINGSLPSLHLVGVGNFGFSVEKFILSFAEGNISSIEMAFKIPGWDALNKFHFKVVQPKLIVYIGFMNQTFKVRANGFISELNEVVSHSNIPGLPIELFFPESPQDSLEIHVADKNAVVDFNSLVPLLSAHTNRETLEAIGSISQSIKVLSFTIRVAPGFSNISVVNVLAISTKSVIVLGKMVIRNATLELTETRNSFQVDIDICGQQLTVATYILKDPKQYLTFETLREVNISISIEDLFSCIEERKDHRPDTNFMRMNVPSSGFRLELFTITYRLVPKPEFAEIAILIGLPIEWNILNEASVPTKLKNATISLKATILSGYSSAEIKAGIYGRVIIGDPILVEFPFVIEIPTKAKSLSLSLQDAKAMKVDFYNMLQLGGISNSFPSFLKTILSDVLVTKVKLQFPSNLTGSFIITELRIEMSSRTKWDFTFLSFKITKVFYTLNGTVVNGEISLGDLSLPCQLEWPSSPQGPKIELSKSVEFNGIWPFVKNVYQTFYGNETLQEKLNGMVRTKLSIISGFSLEKALFHLSSNLTLAKVTVTGALPKYSWQLLSDFFGVEDVSFSINFEIGRPFFMFISGRIVLVGGSANIPFELNVPLSKKQNLTIRLPANKVTPISFKQLTGILTNAAQIKFPTVLGSFLPELLLEKLDISFNENLTAFKIDDFRAVSSLSWDLGGIGALKIDNVTVFMGFQSYKLRGFLLLGNTNLELELTRTSAGQAFRLVRPLNAFGLEQLVKDSLKKMIPRLTNLPDTSLLGINESLVQFAEVELSHNLDSLLSFALTVKISVTWSFFKSCCSLISPTINLRAEDLNDIPSYSLDMTGNLEIVDKEKRLVLPLECNIPESLRSVITLKLRSAVVFNLSKIAVLPLVGNVIPSGLLTPISDFIGNVRLWPLEANFEPLTARLTELNLTATALEHWNLNGFPLALENITLHVNVGQTFNAVLEGKFILKAHPISFQIPFAPTLPGLPEIKMGFEGLPEITLPEIALNLLGGFGLENLFPPGFDILKISLKFLKLRLLPPLRKLQIQSFSLGFSYKGQVILMPNWLTIEDITAEVNIKTAIQVSVAGHLACLITLGTGANVLQAQGALTMPNFASQAWELSIISGDAYQLSAANIVGLVGGGFDLKSLFPDQILSKADKFVLRIFKAAFSPNSRFQVFNITCTFEVNLTDVWLPLGIKIQHIQIMLFIDKPFDAAKRAIQAEVYVEIQLGKSVVPTVLSVGGDFVQLQIRNLENQPLSLSDLASFIGGDQLLKSVPVAFMNFNMVTLNSLSVTFSKPQFDVLNASLQCNLHGFDVGFGFPLPIPDPSNAFKAILDVQYLDFSLKQNNVWELAAGIKASFTGIPLEKHFRDLQGLITVRPRSAIFTVKKALLDVSVDMRLAGIDCNLNVKFSDPKIVFRTPQEPELGIRLDVTGFNALNKLLPFKVFKDRLALDVSVAEKTGMAIKLKTIPILDNMLLCKKEREEYICDFTWLCQEDSYVRFKLPSLAYTRDGFTAIIDVKGLDKLCIPLVLPFMKDFFKFIPFLNGLLKHNIPLWPPTDIIGSLNAIGCNVDNLPKGMEQFRNPQFPEKISTVLSVFENGPLIFSLEVQNGESIKIAMPVSPVGDLAGISLSRFAIGTAFGVPFVDINTEMYLWDLKFVILLSHLPKTNPLLINAEEMETRITCIDCFFIILGPFPIPIFAAPFSIKYATLIDVQAQTTFYHRRPDLKDLSSIASLLAGLLKFYTDRQYLLSLEDFKTTNSTLLVLKLSHGNEMTMLQLPKYTGGKRAQLSVPPLDGKTFLIGWMNFMKTWEPKWLLQIVPLRYRVLDIAFNIGPFRWSLLKFAASSPKELKDNKDTWPYAVKGSGDDALIIASANLPLLSTDVEFRMKNFGNAGLFLRLDAGISNLVKISFDAEANINLKDSSNPMTISGKAHLTIFNVPLLSGRANVTKEMITVFGELKFNFLGALQFGGMIRAVYGPGLVFVLDGNVVLHLLGVHLLNSHLYIKDSLRASVVQATATFMGSKMTIKLLRRGLSFDVEAQAKVGINLHVDLGSMRVFGRDIGRIVLNTGFNCDLKISLPGKSSLKVSFHFMGVTIQLPSLTFNTEDARPDRIPPMLIDHIKNEAPALIKALFLKNPLQLLRAIIDELLDVAGNVGELVKDLLKMGFKLGAELVQDVGRFLNGLADTAKDLAKTAKQAVKAVAETAKALRESATKAAKAAQKVVQEVGKKAMQAGKKLAETGKALAQSIKKVVRIGNAVNEAKRVLNDISKALTNVVNRIAEIAQQIADEIARGIRDYAGKVIEKVGGWLGKRSIYRRDALNDEKLENEEEKKRLQRDKSSQRARIRSNERELERGRKEEQIKRSLRDAARKEASLNYENLRRSLKESSQKHAALDDILNKGKCVTGENNCHPNATCLRSGPDGQSFKCICRRGWIGNGTFCERPIKGLAIMSDSPKAVGEEVSFTAFALSGTNVQYKYSFNAAFSQYGFASFTFSSPGVYIVDTIAKNDVSDARASEVVVVQNPVRNVALKVFGDHRACRAVYLSPSASGTNVSFSIDFGDNVSLHNVTASVTHHFPRSGRFVINVTASNLVSSSSQTYVIIISSSPCDRLYCDISSLEAKFPEKSAIEISSLAWSLLQSSKVGNRERRYNLIWKYLSLFYPVSDSVLKKEDKLRNLDRQYSFVDSFIEIDFILAGMLSSQLEQLERVTVNESSLFPPHIHKPLETFTWITAVLVSTEDFLSTWNASVEKNPLCHERLPTPTIRSAIDGYILGAQMRTMSESEKLSNFLFDYYCPSKPNIQYIWKSRYNTFYNLSKTTNDDGNWDPEITTSTFFNLTSSLEGFVPPIKDFCLSIFLDVLWSELDVTEIQQGSREENICRIHATCQQCLFGGTNSKCHWCESSQACLSTNTRITCNQRQTYFRLPCPKRCHFNEKCSECVSHQSCGWCGPQMSKESSCYEGGPARIKSIAMCSPAEWYHGTCASHCPINQGRVCSGKGVCKIGECYCLPGFYGNDCSKKGCVYTAKQNDSLHSISVWTNVSTVEIQIANRAYLGTTTLAVNFPVTIPKPNCFKSATFSSFHPLFPRMLRIAKNRAGQNSFCGLFGSVAFERKTSSSCKDIRTREQCLRSTRCTWNVREPCTGIVLKGCYRLTHWLDLLAVQSEDIYSPMSGNVKIRNNTIQITGWPESEWEGYVVTVSHLRPLSITSVQGGQTIGRVLSNESSVLPNFVRLSVVKGGVYKDPMAYLLPCSPGCSQVIHSYNGICDQACNTEECHYDHGECMSNYSSLSDISLQPASIHGLYSVTTLKVLYHLQKITGEKHLVIAQGPLSVFSLAKLLVLEMLTFSDLHSSLVYNNHRRRIVNFLDIVTVQNTTMEKLILLTAEKLSEIGVHNVSPYGGHDYDIAEIKTVSLQNQSSFQTGLDVLMEARLLDFTLVQNYSQSVSPYFHLEIPRQPISIARRRIYDPTLQEKPECNSLTSCSGHGVCMNNGTCQCDLFYTGRKCQINNCPGRCSGHGTCIDGVCVCNFGWDGNDCSKIKFCTPLCPEIWIGDGVCDPDCDTATCLQDKGDCQDVCICPNVWLGDGSCDHMCNNSHCKYDGGDCVEEECRPGCRSQMLGDGICDHQCNTELCSLDEGDCDTTSSCSCGQNLQGNGMCDEDCNVSACLYDYGDCALQVSGYNCPQTCSPPMIGNGFCDLSCNESACNFDGGDCDLTDWTMDLCFERCLPHFRGDGVCDSVCNVQACDFDNGDCPQPIVQDCSSACRLNMVGDGICQSQCQVEECSFDANDCFCAPGCSNRSLGDGICNIECFVESCDYDSMDCMCSTKTCPKGYLGNGHCDLECNSKTCDFDGGDCTCSTGCSVTSIGDGHCDPACDTKHCDFDGLDCGGCESESHFDICDENADCIIKNNSLPFVKCHCKSGFYGDGFFCVKRGNCFNGSEICSKNGRCLDSNGTFECYCNQGWVGNGVFCENVDECKDQSHNCSIHAKCVDLPGDYKCTCQAGWTGNGYTCTDIDECVLSAHSCCQNEECVNTEGNYSCACKPGWRKTGNATSASLERCHLFTSPLCIDVDECAEEIHNCSTYEGQANAICTNTNGSFQCSCLQGWQGDGFYCIDIDECVNGSVCGTNQVCRNLAGNYSCSCKDGWTISGSKSDECQDLDECTLGLDDCDIFASCINTNGSFNCECMEGFQDKGRICTQYHCRNQTHNETRLSEVNATASTQELCTCVGEYLNTGRTCEDIDECKWGMVHCPSSAPVCQNLIGGYECKCDAIDNSSCDAVNPCDSSNNTCNDMTCIAVGIEHYCVCPQGYTEDQNGTACIDIDECINLQFYGSCDPNADCINLNGSYECKCRPGFFQSGDVCFEINECDGTITWIIEGRLQECRAGVCAEMQTCIYRNMSSDGSRKDNMTLICACDDSDSSAIDCVEAIMEVIQKGENFTTAISIPWQLTVNTTLNATTNIKTEFVHNCTDKAVCINTAGSYKCICKEGFVSNDRGWNCHDIDECLENGTCHSNATCSNTDGSFRCECKLGFDGNGLNNCSDVDECSLKSVNCSQSSVCVNTLGGYVCACLDGFHRNGTLLCEDLDECSNSALNKCHPRASCQNYVGGYNCSCTTGYSGNGFRCSDIDECKINSILCGEHASCYNTLGCYKCKCDPGWSGDGQNCTNVDECSLGLHTCVENSYCTDNQGSYTCSCYSGWKRQWFEPYGRCSRCDPMHFCSGHGQCLRNGTCDCRSYYSGQNCSVCMPEIRCSGHGTCDFNGNCYCEHGWTRQPQDCSLCLPETLCSGHGSCNYDLTTYKNQSCFCDDRYFGNNCSKACPIEKGEVCGTKGYCNRDPRAVHPCVCFSGYQWNESSSSCEDTNECLLGSHDCLQPAKCINTPGSYRCECPSLVGWSFDGKSCNDTDECQYPNVCDPQATCINFPGGFNCSCNVGWRGQGAHSVCSEIDECAEGTDRCPNPSRCVNTPGSYYCVCNPGWEKVSEFQCVDINECSRGIDGCDPNSACINTPGSWKCTCNNGWYPDPSNARLPTCKDVNECVDLPNACPVQSTCVNSAGAYRCNCLSGWRNRGLHTCVDINECSEGSYSCQSNSRCGNTHGSYQCNCLSGWRHQGFACVDINECSEGSYSCQSHSQCVNTPGSYQCNCVSGWRNQGSRTCVDINECSEGSYYCQSHSRCVNTPGSYQCNCVSGWRNQGPRACVDIDECSEGSHSCPSSPQAPQCVNTQGSYRCECPIGWRRQDSRTCVDIDECNEGLFAGAMCPSHASCVNTLGSYRCEWWHFG